MSCFCLKLILKIFFIEDGIVNAQNLIMDVFVNLLLIKPNVKEIYVKTILLVIGKMIYKISSFRRPNCIYSARNVFDRGSS